MSAGGTIQRIEKGVYRIWLSAGKDENGKRVRISERFRGSYRDAQRRLAVMRASADRGEYVTNKTDTFSAFMKRWWPSKRATLGPVTAQNYDHWIQKYLIPAIGSRPLQKITAGDLAAIVSEPASRGRMSLAEHLYRLLRMIFNRAVTMGEIVRSPVIGVEPSKSVRRELRILQPHEWKAVQDYLADRGQPWWVPVLHVAITTGMRRSEIAGLRWGDLDFARGIMNIQRSVHYVGEHGTNPVVREPKTQRGRRAVALDAGTVEVLLRHREQSDRLATRLGRTLTSQSYIFEQLDGNPTRPGSMSEMWRKVRKEVGISGVRFHDLRHSAATLLLLAGVAPHVVSERLGHSTVGFTLNTYAHVLPSQQAEAAEKLAAMLGGTKRNRALGPESDVP